MKHLISCAALLLLLLSTSAAAQRRVIWQHGLGGSDEFWEEFANQFQRERRLTSTRISANTSAGVRTMAADIVAQTRGVAAPQTIAIGHSMGGVAFREIAARTAPAHVGGLVTVGSPLSGARIADRLQDGGVTNYIEHGVGELLKGPRRSIGILGIVTLGAVELLNGRQLQEILLNKTGVDERIMSLASGPSISDLAENGAYMRQARAYSVNLPRVSIYGNESSPVHYRLASSFSGHPDSHYPGIVNIAEGFYAARSITSFFGIFGPIVGAYKAAGWRAGRDYLRNGSEAGWNTLIGANRTESYRSCTQVLTCDPNFYWPVCVYGNPTPDQLATCRSCYREECRTITRSVNEPSDGLLYVSTQTGSDRAALPSSWRANATLECEFTNHSEFKDHANSEQALNDVFDTRRGVPRFFSTPR